MPRKPRFVIPNMPLHIVQRGHNQAPVFFEAEDREVYLDWLRDAANRYDCAIHAYVLMTNHVHLLITPQDKVGPSRLMQYVGRRYVPYVNHTYSSSGTLWEGRFKANLVQEETYLLRCMRYIELNPVRAKMVRTANQYGWSSYRGNALGRADPLLSPHPIYLRLAAQPARRQAAYRALFKERMTDDERDRIDAAWQTGTPLGTDTFLNKVEKVLKRKVGYARPGRPPKPQQLDKGARVK